MKDYQEMTSQLGRLLHRFDYTGLDNNPVITKEELADLNDRLSYLYTVAIDIEDKPLRFWCVHIQSRVQTMIFNRTNK